MTAVAAQRFGASDPMAQGLHFCDVEVALPALGDHSRRDRGIPKMEVFPMKQHVWISFAMLSALALAGCGRTTSALQADAGGGPPAGSDQSQVATVVENNPGFVDEDVWQSQLAQTYDNPGGFAAVRPLRFWREITSVERTVDTEFGAPDSSGRPTLALVTIHKHLQGTFNIRAGVADSPDTSVALIKKPLDDNWTRKLMLMRRSMPGDSGRWHLVGTSGVEVNTRGGE